MKIIYLLMSLIVFCTFGCQSDMHAAAGNAAVREVIVRKDHASLDCARILIDENQIASIHIHGLAYLDELKAIDVSNCPKRFCAAWSNYLSAWKNKLTKDHATKDSLDVISMYKGSFGDLPTIAGQIEAYDTLDAWQQCEQSASKFGVDVRTIRVE